MNAAYNVIIRPVVAERSFDLMGQNKYTFEVARTAPKEEIAAYAKLVFRAYEQGDAVAGEILQGRAAVLRHQLRRAREMYDVGTRVILAGGLTRDREIVLSLLDAEELSYVIPSLPPIFGACSYCARMLGEPPADFAANFEKEYTSLIKE